MGQFRFLTGGESHGKGLVAVVEGMVADLPLEEEYINKELKRRQQGYGRGPRMKIEEDKAEIMAGVRFATGSLQVALSHSLSPTGIGKTGRNS